MWGWSEHCRLVFTGLFDNLHVHYRAANQIRIYSLRDVYLAQVWVGLPNLAFVGSEKY